ncbi:MAG: outer membrane lipoprotein carrier protein LolA [Acetobacteraceae bacterium]|nr:outer membrane lipoprotein carrier protein LolA [Acetobacteraceae bacterium]
MKRRSLLSAAALAAPPLLGRGAEAQTPANSAAEVVGRVEAYFNTLTTLRARFLQTAQGGGSAQGTAYIWRPSRMRFEYDPPEQTLLIAADAQFFHWDGELRQASVVPLSSTPLGVLLRSPLRLTGDVTVSNVERAGGLLRVTVHRTNNAGEGRIQLVLEEEPMQLRQWVVQDAQGRITRVTLTEQRVGERFDPFLFAFNDPRFRERLEQQR